MTPPADAWPGPDAIIAHARDAIIGETSDGVIASWNPAAAALFGYSDQEAIGRPIALLALAVQDHDGAGHRIFRDDDVVVFRDRDGVSTVARVRISQVCDVEGRPAGRSYIIRPVEHDHDDRGELHRQLAHLSRLGAMGQMAPLLAHELKQPLTAIVTYLTSARRLLRAAGSSKMEMLTDVMDEALSQARRADQIIRHLRSFVSDGRPERQRTEIGEIIAEVVDLVSIAARQAGVTMPGGPIVRAAVLVDRVQVQQVLFNLMRNAIEAMTSAPVRELRLAVGVAGNMVQVSVADTGPGVPPEVTARLFEPFVTTKHDGMGLGLSICRTIVEQHGGRMWFEPAVSGGAAVHFTLPLADDAEARS